MAMTSLYPHDLRGRLPVDAPSDQMIQDLSRALGYIEATAANALRRGAGLGDALRQIRDIAKAAAEPDASVTAGSSVPAGVDGTAIGTRHQEAK